MPKLGSACVSAWLSALYCIKVDADTLWGLAEVGSGRYATENMGGDAMISLRNCKLGGFCTENGNGEGAKGF
jgi:hypothetical protein